MRKNLKWSGLAVAAVAAGVFLWLGRSSEEASVRPDVQGQEDVVASTPVAARKMPQAASAAFAVATNQTPTVRGTLPYVLTSVKPFTQPLRLAAEDMGAKTVAILDRNAALIEATPATRARLASDGRFRKVTEFAPQGKIQPALAALIDGGAEKVEVSIVSLVAEDRRLVQACLEAGGGEMLTGCINEGDTLRARLPASLVATLAARGDVRWMERFERPHLMNDVAVNPPAMNVREVWDAHGLDLTGAGQNISTSDSGIDTGCMDTMHLDLRDRVKDIQIVEGCVTNDVIGHGTHTAGSIVGDGTRSAEKIRGTAYGANLYAWFCGTSNSSVRTPNTMASLFRHDGQWDAYIHSASWGSDTDGLYTSACAKNDEYVWANPEFLPVYSAGNNGSGRQTIGSPAAAKNVLAVGATQNSRQGFDGGWGNGNPTETVAFSSRGPCCDGRIKPDIAAPGSGILSTRAHGVNYSYGNYDEYYAYDSGTSMACPLTAGSVALVRQWLVQRKGFKDEAGKRPTAALMKAVITGGAKGAATPNNSQGWGRVDLANTLAPTDGRDVLLVDRIEFAQDQVFEYLVQTTNAAPLDVQLCWIDYPGDVSGSQATPRLINDLDLTVESLDGESGVLLGNGGKTADTLNNMESVRIATAAPSRYLITVKCSHIAYDHTEGGAAALYVRGAFDPTAEPKGLERVRIQRTPDVAYRTLDEALADVQDNDVVEVLDAVTLREPMTLTNSITLCATNELASASPVKRVGGACLTVAPDVRLTLTNLVFTGTDSIPVTVEAGGTLVHGTNVSFGMPFDKVSVRTSDENGYELAGSLTASILLQCTNQAFMTPLELEGARFGTYSCWDTVAEASAQYIVNAYDATGDRLIRGSVSDSKRLCWMKHDCVPFEDAGCYTVGADGTINTYARLDRLIEEGGVSRPEIVIRRPSSLSKVVAVDGRALTIRSEDGATITPKSANEETPSAFVIGEGGTLTVSNVVFSGFSQFGDVGSFVKVEKGGAFRMLEGAEIRDICNAGMLGAVYVAGAMSMTNGARIAGCVSDDGCGGGVYLRGTLDFCGAEITGCRADDHGGGVYVETDATLNLSGAARITGNVQRGEFSQQSVADDIYVRDSAGTLSVKVANVLPTARIGVHPSSCDREEREAVLGKAFATLTDEMSQETAAAVFFNDVYNDYYTGLVGSVSESGDKLVWVAKEVKPGSVPESEGTIVVDIGGETNYYKVLSSAFKSVADGETAKVLLLTNVLMDADITVKGRVTLDGSDWMVYQGEPDSKERFENRFFTVSGAETSLCLTNVTVSGCDEAQEGYYAYGTLFKVLDGASLTLEKDACVEKVCESDEGYWPGTYSLLSTLAIDVSGGAWLTMKSGATVWQCWNNDLDEENVVAGSGIGLTGEGTVFRMEGGRVSMCNAMYGGGVMVQNGAEIRVSGDARIVNNENFDQADENLYANDGRRVVLTDVFTGKIGYTLGATKADSETNVFGTVDSPVSLWQLANSATNFYKDADQDVTGRIVTNATETLLVWSSAVSAEGVFTDKDGNRYDLVDDKEPPPTPVSVEPVAFKSITRISETEWQLVVTNRKARCRYALTYTDDLKKGFVTTGDWETANADGPWTTNVIFKAEELRPAFFWKALGRDAEISETPNP